MTRSKDIRWAGISPLLPPPDSFPVSVSISLIGCIWQADTLSSWGGGKETLGICSMMSFQPASCSTVSKEPSFHECPGRWLFYKVHWNSLSENGQVTSYQLSRQKHGAVGSLRSAGLTECTKKRTAWLWCWFLSRSVTNSHSIRTVGEGWKFQMQWDGDRAASCKILLRTIWEWKPNVYCNSYISHTLLFMLSFYYLLYYSSQRISENKI